MSVVAARPQMNSGTPARVKGLLLPKQPLYPKRRFVLFFLLFGAQMSSDLHRPLPGHLYEGRSPLSLKLRARTCPGHCGFPVATVERMEERRPQSLTGESLRFVS